MMATPRGTAMEQQGSIPEKLARFSELWRPKVIAALNGQEVKLVKVQGVFPWHLHETCEELFLVCLHGPARRYHLTQSSTRRPPVPPIQASPPGRPPMPVKPAHPHVETGPVTQGKGLDSLESFIIHNWAPPTRFGIWSKRVAALAAPKASLTHFLDESLHAAWKMDKFGNKAARTDVSAIKIVAARLQTRVLDRAIQVFGAAGLTEDTPLAYLWTWGRALRFIDGPDEVHLRTVARAEMKKTDAQDARR